MAEVELTDAVHHCTILPLTNTHMRVHTCTTFTRNQAMYQKINKDIPLDGRIKDGDFFLLFCLSEVFAMTMNSV